MIIIISNYIYSIVTTYKMFPHMKNDDSLCPYKRLLVLHIKNIHFDRTNKYFRHVGGFDAWSGFK